MICSNCGNEQDSGKFCGKCGTPLTAETAKETEQETPVTQSEESPSVTPTQQAEAAAAVEQPAAVPNPSIEKAKKTSMQYLNFFTTFVKSPTKAFEQSESNWLNGLITTIAVALILTFSIYSVINGFISKAAAEAFYFDPLMSKSYFSLIFPRAFAIIAGMIASIILVVFGVTHAFIRPISLKSVVGMYGSLMLPVVIMSAIVWLLIAINSYSASYFVFAITLSMITVISPFVILFHVSENIKTKIDRLYIGLIYIVGYSVVTFILGYILLESTIMKIITFVDEII